VCEPEPITSSPRCFASSKQRLHRSIGRIENNGLLWGSIATRYALVDAMPPDVCDNDHGSHSYLPAKFVSTVMLPIESAAVIRTGFSRTAAAKSSASIAYRSLFQRRESSYAAALWELPYPSNPCAAVVDARCELRIATGASTAPDSIYPRRRRCSRVIGVQCHPAAKSGTIPFAS